MGSLSRVSWKSSSFFYRPSPHLFLVPEVMEIIFLALEPWAVQLGLGLGSHTPKVSLLIFIHHTRTWSHPCSFHHYLCTTLHLLSSLPHLHISTLPHHLDECGLFKSLVIIFPYNFISWQFWVLFVLRFSCNSFCGCVRRQSLSTYASILTGSPPLPNFHVADIWNQWNTELDLVTRGLKHSSTKLFAS